MIKPVPPPIAMEPLATHAPPFRSVEGAVPLRDLKKRPALVHCPLCDTFARTWVTMKRAPMNWYYLLNTSLERMLMSVAAKLFGHVFQLVYRRDGAERIRKCSCILAAIADSPWQNTIPVRRTEGTER